MQKLIILALCFSAALGGQVDHTRCGGVGTLHHIAVENCSGAQCDMNPATPYPCEGHLTPSSSSPSLTLMVTATYLGFPITIIDAVVPDSSVQGGVAYTVRFTITPNDILSGNTIPVNAEVRHTNTGLVEVCGTIRVHIR